MSSVEGYFSAVNSIDRAAYLACFAPDAVVQEPYGGRPFSGHEALNKFFNGMERTWDSFTMTPVATFAVADRVAVHWTTTATAKSGKTAEFAGINLFTLNADGQISHLEAYWDFKAMVAQIS